jgi:hypothetical protein
VSAPSGTGTASGNTGDAGDPRPAWQAYEAAARQLDAIRRAAVAEAARHGRAMQAARDELSLVRAQMSASQERLRGLGASPASLLPREADVSAAEQLLDGRPGDVLDALHRARSTLESSDAALIGQGTRRRIRLSRLARRNLLGYAPLALAALVGQVMLYLIASGGPATTPVLLVGPLISMAAFGLGWLTVGHAFPAGPSGRVERTPLLGVVVCAVPALVAFVVAVVVK